MPESAEHQVPDSLTGPSDPIQEIDALDHLADGVSTEETSLGVERVADTSLEDGQTTEETDEVRDFRMFTTDDFNETTIGERRKVRRAMRVFENTPIGQERPNGELILDPASADLVDRYAVSMADVIGSAGNTLDDETVDRARAIQREFNEALGELYPQDPAAETAAIRAFNARLIRETSETPPTGKSKADQLSSEPAVVLKPEIVEAGVEAKTSKSNRFVSWVRTAAKGFIDASGLGVRNINTATDEYGVIEPAIAEAALSNTQEDIIDYSSEPAVEPAPAATLLHGVDDTMDLPVIHSPENEHHRDVRDLIDERDRLESEQSLGTLATVGETEYTIDSGAEDAMIGARKGEDARRYSLRERRQLAKDGKGKFTAMDGTQFLDRNGKLPALVIPRKLDVAGNEVDAEGKIIPKEDRVFVDEDGGASRFRTQNVRSIARQARTYSEAAAMSVGELARDIPLRVAETRARTNLVYEGLLESLSSKSDRAKSRLEKIQTKRKASKQAAIEAGEVDSTEDNDATVIDLATERDARTAKADAGELPETIGPKYSTDEWVVNF